MQVSFSKECSMLQGFIGTDKSGEEYDFTEEQVVAITGW
jgi:hypothetical protein